MSGQHYTKCILMEFLNVTWDVASISHGTNLCSELQGQQKPFANSSQCVDDRDQSILRIGIWWHGFALLKKIGRILGKEIKPVGCE